VPTDSKHSVWCSRHRRWEWGLEGLGDHCSYPGVVWGRAPTANTFWWNYLKRVAAATIFCYWYSSAYADKCKSYKNYFQTVINENHMQLIMNIIWSWSKIIHLSQMCHMYTMDHKNVTLYFGPYLHQLLTDLKNFFTVTLCRQFAIMWLLYISPHHKCISLLPCEILIKYAYITRITNKHFGWMICNTLNCVGLT